MTQHLPSKGIRTMNDASHNPLRGAIAARLRHQVESLGERIEDFAEAPDALLRPGDRETLLQFANLSGHVSVIFGREQTPLTAAPALSLIRKPASCPLNTPWCSHHEPELQQCVSRTVDISPQQSFWLLQEPGYEAPEVVIDAGRPQVPLSRIPALHDALVELQAAVDEGRQVRP